MNDLQPTPGKDPRRSVIAKGRKREHGRFVAASKVQDAAPAEASDVQDVAPVELGEAPDMAPLDSSDGWADVPSPETVPDLGSPQATAQAGELAMSDLFRQAVATVPRKRTPDPQQPGEPAPDAAHPSKSRMGLLGRVGIVLVGGGVLGLLAVGAVKVYQRLRAAPGPEGEPEQTYQPTDTDDQMNGAEWGDGYN